jgi:hypothetical protein
MKAKTITVIFVTTILALMWCSAAWADRSNIRDHRQTKRIRQGVRSGEITRPEVRRLKKEQRRIDSAYHRASADGHVNWRERQRLDKMQDRASRHIYQAKHNRANRRLHKHYRNGAYRAYHHRHAVGHKHTVNCYYPVINTGYTAGYGFSVGVSNMGWQFAFSTGDSY